MSRFVPLRFLSSVPQKFSLLFRSLCSPNILSLTILVLAFLLFFFFFLHLCFYHFNSCMYVCFACARTASMCHSLGHFCPHNHGSGPNDGFSGRRYLLLGSSLPVAYVPFRVCLSLSTVLCSLTSSQRRMRHHRFDATNTSVQSPP